MQKIFNCDIIRITSGGEIMYSDELLRIGDFSEIVNISVRMLRYYDDEGLFKPFITDEFTGYRFYHAEQIPLIQRIILLRDMNFSVKQIKEIINSRDDSIVTENLLKRKSSVLHEISLMYETVKKIDTAVENIKNNEISLNCNITFKSVPKMNIVSFRGKIPSYNDEKILWNRLDSLIKNYRINIRHDMSSNICIFHDDLPPKDLIDIEVGYITDETNSQCKELIFRETESIDLMLCMMVRGPYSNLKKSYDFLGYWLDLHKNYKINGKSRQICHISSEEPFFRENQENYITEIQIPVIKI